MVKINKKFCEEAIAYYPLTVFVINDTTNRKNKLLRMRNEVKNNTVQEAAVLIVIMGVIEFMKHSTEMAYT
jgi:hypothetical protein